MKIVIRSDAGEHIGNGHVMRCLTLAQQLYHQGHEVHFISRPFQGHLIDLIERKGFIIHQLPLPDSNNDWLGVSANTEQQQSTHILTQLDTIDWIIVDHYGIDIHWHKAIRPYTKHILVIDDLANRKHDCDLLLDQNLYHHTTQRYKEYVPQHCQLLLGPRYALLRNQFSAIQKTTQNKTRSKEVKNLLIFMGGVDKNNDTYFVLQQLKQSKLNKLEIRVILGGNNPHSAQIKNICASLTNTVLHIDVHNIAKHMAWADLSIGSGGSTTWERCSLGLPTLAWSIAKNQIELLEVAADTGILFYLHDRSLFIPYLQVMLDNPLLYKKMSQKALSTCDAYGTKRVLQAIANIDINIDIRLATLEDSEDIYRWRNNKRIRHASMNRHIILFEDHMCWFRQILVDTQRQLLIGEINQQAIGVVRFDKISNTRVEISLYLVPDKLGQGLGQPLLYAAEKWLKKADPTLQSIQATINEDNIASKKLFSRLAYDIKHSHYEKTIGHHPQ